MNNFRKTKAYQACGITFFVISIFFVLCVVVLRILPFTAVPLSLLAFGYICNEILDTLFKVFSITGFVFFIILCFTAYLKNQNFNSKQRRAADIGCVLIFITFFIFITQLIQNFKIFVNETAFFVNHIVFKMRTKDFEPYSFIHKDSCIFLNERIPKITEKLGGSFTVEQFYNELAKTDNIYDLNMYETNYGKTIAFKRNLSKPRTHEQEDVIELVFSKNTTPCSLDEKNCYIYHYFAENDCKFYYDSKGKAVPSEETLNFINQ